MEDFLNGDLEEKHKEAIRKLFLAVEAEKSGQLFTCEQRLKYVINLLASEEDVDSLKIKAKALNLLANTLSQVRRFDEAEQFYLEARNIYKNKLNLPDKESASIHGLGNLYFYKSDFDTAILYFKESLSIKEKLLLDANDMFPALFGLATCYIELEKLDEALEIIHKCAKQNVDDEHLEELWARFFASQGNSAKVIEKLEAMLLRLDERDPIQKTRLELSLAVAYNHLEKYEIAELHFWNSFSSLESHLNKWLSPTIREGLRKSFLIGIEEQFRIWRIESKENYKVLDVIERLSAIDLRAKFDAEHVPIEINDSTLKLLSNGEVLVYLFGTNSVLYTYFLDNCGIVLADSALYDEHCQFDALSDFDYLSPHSYKSHKEFVACYYTVLGTALMVSMLPSVPNKICLLFPFGKGNNVPWEYFIANLNKFFDNQKKNDYTSVSISRLPSFSVYRTLKSSVFLYKSREPPVVFADPLGPFLPLPEALEEAKEIQNLFPEIQVFTGKEASIGKLLSVFRPSFLHISCHGFFDETNPLESSLGLSTNGLSEQDERLWREWQTSLRHFLQRNPSARIQDFNMKPPTSYDGRFNAHIFRLQELNGTEFVFLSACSVGRVSDYDEVQGFAQSVFLAGCPNLVAPLWPVSINGALVFTKAFYKEYKKLSHRKVPTNGKIGSCVATARNVLFEEGFSDRESAAWTVFGLG